MTDKNKELSEKIIAFLDSHKFITPTRIEKKLKIPNTTISQAKTGGRAIPKKYLDALIEELKNYGFLLIILLR